MDPADLRSGQLNVGGAVTASEDTVDGVRGVGTGRDVDHQIAGVRIIGRRDLANSHAHGRVDSVARDLLDPLALDCEFHRCERRRPTWRDADEDGPAFDSERGKVDGDALRAALGWR